MALENGIWVFGLHHIQVTRQRLEVFAQLRVRNDLLKVTILAHVGGALAGKHKCELLQSDGVSALLHKLCDQFSVVHLLGDTHRFWVLLELAVDVEGRAEGLLHFFGVGSVVGTREQVVADALEVVGVGEVFQSGEALNLKQEIDSFGLLIMVNEFRDYLVDKLVDLVD